MAKATKSVRRARATRKTAKRAQSTPLLTLNVTAEALEAIAAQAMRDASEAAFIAAICNKATPKKDHTAIFAARDAAKDAAEAKCSAIVERICGNWSAGKVRAVRSRDDLLTLAIIAYRMSDKDGSAKRVLVHAILGAGGIYPSERTRWRLVAPRRRLVKRGR